MVFAWRRGRRSGGVLWGVPFLHRLLVGGLFSLLGNASLVIAAVLVAALLRDLLRSQRALRHLPGREGHPVAPLLILVEPFR